jgi:hypothetical protein
VKTDGITFAIPDDGNKSIGANAGFVFENPTTMLDSPLSLNGAV